MFDIYYRATSPSLNKPFLKQRQESWLRKLGTTFPYGCDDNVDGEGDL